MRNVQIPSLFPLPAFSPSTLEIEEQDYQPACSKGQQSTWRPISLSLFSGAGGMDLGVSQAGFDILTSIERDPYCCKTLRTWTEQDHLQRRIIEADIRTVDPGDLLSSLSLKTGELDLLFGGPPCQAFSQIGKRASLNDERGMLLFEIIRFAEVFRPRAILIEQVKGLLNAPDHTGSLGAFFLSSCNNLNNWAISRNGR